MDCFCFCVIVIVLGPVYNLTMFVTGAEYLRQGWTSAGGSSFTSAVLFVCLCV